MKIEELFRQLSLGELSNLSLSADGGGVIRPADAEKVLLHVQSGLDTLYGRFLLLEKNLILKPVAGRYSYPLLARYSEFGREDPDSLDPIFIMDTAEEPFTEDVIRVIGAEDQECRPIKLNDESVNFSLFTPAPEVIQWPKHVPEWLTILTASLTYQAKHPKLDPQDIEQEFVLPTALLTALRYFVAGSIYSNMNGDANSAKGLEFMTKYEQACLEVSSRDLVSQSSATQNHKFVQNGWV